MHGRPDNPSFPTAAYQREAILAAMSFSQADAPCLDTGCFGNPFIPSIFSSTDFILEKSAADLCSDSTKVEQARTDCAVGQPDEHGESDSVLLTDSPARFATDTLSQKAGQQDRVTLTDEPDRFTFEKKGALATFCNPDESGLCVRSPGSSVFPLSHFLLKARGNRGSAPAVMHAVRRESACAIAGQSDTAPERFDAEIQGKTMNTSTLATLKREWNLRHCQPQRGHCRIITTPKRSKIMTWFKTHQPFLAGIMLVVSSLLMAGSYALDDNPQTNPDWTQVIAAVAGLGLIRSRQVDVTSEEVKADKAKVKREEKANASLPFPVFLMLFTLGPILTIAPGCTTPNHFSLKSDNSVVSNTGTQSLAKMQTGENTLTALYNGVAPAQGMMDDKGIWYNTPGSGALLVFDPVTGKVMSMSPQDTVFVDVTVTPNPKDGEPSFKAARIETNISNLSKIYAEQFAAGVEATKNMSQAEATARVNAMIAAGEITSNIGKAVLESMYPTKAAVEAVTVTTPPATPQDSSDGGASTDE